MRRMVLAAAVALCTAAGAADTTVIGGHTYVFPPAAFMGGSVETGRVGSVLLELAWPEMRPLTPDEAVAWPIRDTILVLANSGAPVNGEAVPADELLAEMPNRVNMATDLSGGIDARASGHVPAPLLNPTPVASGDAVPGDGMQRVQVMALPTDSIKYDVFVAEPLDQPKHFVSCDRPSRSIVNPQCSEVFLANNMIIKASYRRALVPQWREIEAKTIGFLQKHDVRE